MFGYLQIQKSELKVCEYDSYKAVYCGLCKQLGKDYSFLTRLILSYDCTFYAMLLMSVSRTCTGFVRKRCTCNPFKKCNFARCKSDSYNKATAFTVISAYYKIKDDIADGNFLKKLRSYLVLPFFSHWRKKAVKKYGYTELDSLVSNMLSMQLEDENSDTSNIDTSAHPTALMLAKLFESEAKTENDKRVYYEFGYNIGRWIYLIDAADDLQKDLKNNNFNPFVRANRADYNYIQAVLNQSLARAFYAYNLMNITDFKGILDNMLLLGFPAMQNKVVSKLKTEVEND
ncbi:MAG: hypothetical protein J1E85_05210 [Ruminococcus sp.]|nr:hypothetical protein [Ruminococcus sp.]